MIGCRAEILEQWPRHRDPELPPFFIYTSGESIDPQRKCRYKIGGTFRNGITFHFPIPSLPATPTGMPEEDCGRKMTFDTAIKIADKLNSLHDCNLIDWNGDSVKIVKQTTQYKWISEVTQILKKTPPI